MAFFSGQDLKTLQSEGNDTNCFVSLIVDTKGTYVAAITRKVHAKSEVITKNHSQSYEFFGEGEVSTGNEGSEDKIIKEDTIIEYFMLDVEREVTDNPYDYLDARFDAIETKKKAESSRVAVPPAIISKVSDDEDFFDWIHANRRKETEAEDKSYNVLTPFSEEIVEEMENLDDWQPDHDVIHYLACQMVTCSLIVNKDIDLKQWITRHMDNKYKEIFSDRVSFDNWREFIVEFLIDKYEDPIIGKEVQEDLDPYQSKIADALYAELYPYSDNKYIQEYMEMLSRYNYE